MLLDGNDRFKMLFRRDKGSRRILGSCFTAGRRSVSSLVESLDPAPNLMQMRYF